MPEDQRKRVLLVEDNEDARALYSMFLRHNGFEVTEAVDGEQGLSKALADPPDVMVLDIGLPKIDGFEVARRLRQFRPTASIPIIAVSAQAMLGFEEVATNAGCTEALSKPCMPSDLLDVVNRLLARRA